MRNQIEFYASCLVLFVLPAAYLAWLAFDALVGVRRSLHRYPLLLAQSVFVLIFAVIMADVVRQSIWGAP